MRWPLQHQILWPFVAIQVLTVAAITLTAAWLAVERADQVLHQRLDDVIHTLEETTFPLTPVVLTQLQELSSAEFIVLGTEREPVLSTFPDVPVIAPPLADFPGQQIGEHVLTVQGHPYIAGVASHGQSQQPQQVLVLYSQADWFESQRQAMWPPVLIGGALLIPGIFASALSARQIARRIAQVQRQVTRIAHLDFAPLPLPGTHDELRDLAEDTNRMAQLLHAAIQKAADSERSRLLTQMVGGVAHQFRNAITGARIAIQLHQRRCPAAQDESLQVSLQQLRLTEEQIKSLLRVARGEQGPIQPGNLLEVLQDVLSLLKPLCEHQQIQLQVDLAAESWPVPDREAMQGALLNLLTNAAEATGPHGSIQVTTVRKSTGEFEISINNTGPAPGDVSRLFEPFYSTKPEGVGLGLYLAKQAVSDCGGELTCEHAAGTTQFRIRWLA